MGGSLSQLTSRQLERLKSELAEVIIANFCYPTFLDYRLNRLRTRPVDRRKRQEVWAYVNGLNFGPLDTMDTTSMEFRRFVERVFLRAIEMNRALLVANSERQITAARARVPQLAAQVAHGFADYLMLGEASDFGRARPIESWASVAPGYSEPTWEQIEKSTQLLQTTLVYLRVNSTKSTEQPANASVDQRDNKLLAVITAFPTQLLVSPPERFASPVEVANGAASATLHESLDDHEEKGAADGIMPPQVLLEAEPGPRRQFLGPARSPTASRPVDAPSSLQAKAQGDPSWGEAPAPPPVSVQPMAAKNAQQHPASMHPAPAGGDAKATPHPAAAGVVRDAQPGPAPMALPEMQTPVSPDAWQALLLPEGQEQPAELSARGSAPQPIGLPDDDSLDLPESFGAPHLFDLPPDLAELYGDYLRDSRAISFDPETPAPQKPGAAPSQDVPPAAQAPAAEIDEEIDALFSALTNQVEELDKSEWTAIQDQNAALKQPSDISSTQPAPHVQSGSLHGSQEPENLLRSDEAVASEYPHPAAIKAGTDGDVMIFSQLQHQIFTWVKMAAISHQIDLAGRDAAELVVELRRAAALDEAELQVIESLIAICRRVAATRRATIEDYKQAMMLYLLHHRSRLAL